MKKVQIKERFENAVDAFFDNENLDENNVLSFSDNPTFSNFEETESFAINYTTLIKILKQVFLFLPGASVLFFMSVAFTGFLILRPTLGSEHHLYLGIFITFIAGLMTFLGLGDWRKPKHLFIPLSIVSLSVILAVVGSITHGVDNFPHFIDYYAANFLPLAFVLPFLAKGLIDKTGEEKSGV